MVRSGQPSSRPGVSALSQVRLPPVAEGDGVRCVADFVQARTLPPSRPDESVSGLSSGVDVADASPEGVPAGEWESVLRLYTPAQAAELLSVRESWLRRRAGRRQVPCTFLGKHLRFSATDLRAIAARGARGARPQHPRRTR